VKNNSLLLLILTMAIVWSFTPQAYPMGRKPPAKKAPIVKKAPVVKKASVVKEAPQIFEANGKITALGAQNSTITILRNASATLVININKNTLYYKEGKSIKAAEIKIGDFAAVTYEIIKDSKIAKSVKIQDKAAAIIKK
jgi:hypothetical protein